MTFAPGRARWSPATTTQSSVVSPFSITRMPSTSGPISTRRRSHRVVGTDHQSEAAALIGAERFLGHEHPAPARERNAQADEQARQDRGVGVGKHGARFVRAGRGVDLVARVVHLADVRKALLGRQRHVGDHALSAGIRGFSEPVELAVDEQIALAHLEVGVHRVWPDDGREHSRIVGADEVADVDEVAVDASADGRVDVRVGQVELRGRERRLGLLYRGTRFVTRLLLLNQIGLAAGLLLEDRRRDRVLLFRRRGARLRALRVGFGLVYPRLVKLGLDHEQEIALLHLGAGREVHADEYPLHSRADLDRLDGARLPGGLQIDGDLLLDRMRDRDLGRRWRNVGVAAATRDAGCRQGRGRNGDQTASDSREVGSIHGQAHTVTARALAQPVQPE